MAVVAVASFSRLRSQLSPAFAAPRSPLATPAVGRHLGVQQAAYQDDTVATELLPNEIAEDALLPGERFVVMNRFAVRDGAGPQFEQRWADRDSNLLTLDGFHWFSLLERVPPTGADASFQYPDDNSYMSLTTWDAKKSFNAWRKSPAFKASHGGDNILGFIGMMVSNFMTATGPPKPAFWKSVLLEKASDPSPLVNTASADGEQVLPPEVFVSMNRFSVQEGRERDFEQRWATRQSRLDGMQGFRSFQLLRRHQVPDDQVNYISMAVWDDRAAFDAWRNSEAFKEAHASRPEGSPSRASSSGPMGGMLKRPPTPYFYEGKLVVESDKGL